MYYSRFEFETQPANYALFHYSLTSDAVFEDAAVSFQAGLSPSAKALFTPVKTLDDLHMFLDSQTQKFEERKRKPLLRGCQAIDKFSRTMQPYFDVVDTPVSSHPEYATILWGAIKFVFQVRIPQGQYLTRLKRAQLSRHYSTFFEKVTNKYQEMASNLPIYSRQIKLIRARAQISSWRSSHGRLSISLAYVYTDILQFSFDACQTLTSKSSGKLFRIVPDCF